MSALKIDEYEGIATVSRVRSSNVATIIVSGSHGFSTGDTVIVSGLGGTGYNATATITVSNSTTFTYANSGGDEGTTGDTAGRAYSSFTLPYNPNNIEFASSKFMDKKNLPYSFTFIGMTSSIKGTINITLNGHFDGSTKNTNYRSLVARVNAEKIYKLFYQNDYDKFYLCTGVSIQKVPTGLRPLHLDYVAAFFSPFGMLFDATQKSGLYNSSEKNTGDVPTPIEKITGTVTIATQVTIKDASGNGFIFTPSASGTMTYNIAKVISLGGDISMVEYMHVDVNGATQALRNATTSGDMMLRLDAGQSLNNIFAAGTITNTTPTFYFRNGWASD